MWVLYFSLIILTKNYKNQVKYEMNAMFVSRMIFSRKWVIFQKIFSIKLSHFPIFDNNLKWVEKQSHNFPYLTCCEIKLFFK